MSAFSTGFKIGFMSQLFNSFGFMPRFPFCAFPFGGFGYCYPSSLFMVPNMMTSNLYQYSVPQVSVNIPQVTMPVYSKKSVWDNSYRPRSYIDDIKIDRFEKTPTTVVAEQKSTENTSSLEKFEIKRNKNIPATETKYDNLIFKYSDEYGIDADLVRAMIKNESGFNPNAKSSAGAIGLMQLMPIAAKHYGVTDSYDPEQNIKGGVKYIKEMLDKYDGDVELALTAYNAGPSRVKKGGQIPQNGETPQYVNKVMKSYNEYKSA